MFEIRMIISSYLPATAVVDSHLIRLGFGTYGIKNNEQL